MEILEKNKNFASDSAFPDNFFWGCATSAHQIEGGLINDWTEWEKSPARIKDLERKQQDPLDFISGAAANSFIEDNADIACLKDLANNAYRFSVDWSRIEPQEGKFDEAALDYYRDLVKKLLSNDIKPFVTLWHWPLPLWVRDIGGWKNRKTVDYFCRFVNKVGHYLNEEVDFWITLNEPMVYSSQSYLVGEWPPQARNPFSFWLVLDNLARAHRAAYDVLKKIDGNNQIGIAKHNVYFESAGGPINAALKALGDWFQNRYFLNKIKGRQDFIGLNYYFHNYVNYGFSGRYSYERESDMAWGLYPEGIRHLLSDLRRYDLPIYITENGLADRGDQHRSWYIREILTNVRQAVSEGVDVRGYFHWSLIDNFEWSHGFKPRFGLYEVDYQTFERRPRSSAEVYADICRRNSL